MKKLVEIISYNFERHTLMNTFKQIILTGILLLISLHTYADKLTPYSYTVSGEDETYISVLQIKSTTDSTYNELVTHYDSNASSVYLPIDSNSIKYKYSTVDYPDQLAGNSDDSFLKITLETTTTTSSTRYINAAYEDPDTPDSYNVIPFIKTRKSTGSSYEDSDYQQYNDIVTDQAVTLFLNVKHICEGDCNLTSSTREIKVYFFLTDTNLSTGTTIKTTDYPNGMTIKFILGDIVPNYYTKLVELRKGDERLIANIDSSVIQYPYKTAIFYKKDSTDVNDVAYDEYAAVKDAGYNLFRLESYVSNGDVTIHDLVNDTNYSVVVALINKFQFGTKASNAMSNKPESIETFLQEQQCYLLSAGFQEEHYVIEYFKHIRDDYLLKSLFGKKIVQFYYWSAPHFTHYIYTSKLLSALFRGIGYTLYFIFHYFYYLLFTGVGLLLITLNNRRHSH